MTTASLLWGLFFGSIGAGMIVYARRQRAPVPLIAGIGLILCRMVLTNTLALICVCSGLALLPYFIRI